MIPSTLYITNVHLFVGAASIVSCRLLMRWYERSVYPYVHDGAIDRRHSTADATRQRFSIYNDDKCLDYCTVS